MSEYYNTCPSVVNDVDATDDAAEESSLSEFDKHSKTLLANDAEEGWASELRRYLGSMQIDGKKDANIIEWWQVSTFSLLIAFIYTY